MEIYRTTSVTGKYELWTMGMVHVQWQPDLYYIFSEITFGNIFFTKIRVFEVERNVYQAAITCS